MLRQQEVHVVLISTLFWLAPRPNRILQARQFSINATPSFITHLKGATRYLMPTII